MTHPLDGMGFVVPAIEKRQLIACSFSSVKFAGRAPQDTVLLRAFVGGALQPEQYAMSDADMRQAVLQELGALLGITGAPLHCSISRHANAMAQYHVGHSQRVAHLSARVRQFPGLVLVGNAYQGVGIPDCIGSGENAAQDILTHLFPGYAPES
jgi:oxygen-dependent protoporphyrinogen oxidase